MADRSSAAIFGAIFDHIALPGHASKSEFAKWLWRESQGYDFSPCQMECDEALIKLGLVAKCASCSAALYEDEYGNGLCWSCNEPDDG